MGVNEEDVVNIMGGMEHAGGIKLNDHKRKLKNRWVGAKGCLIEFNRFAAKFQKYIDDLNLMEFSTFYILPKRLNVLFVQS